MASQWDSVLSDKKFQILPIQDKILVAQEFFNENIGSDPKYTSLPDEDKAFVRGDFFSTLQQKVPFEGRYPNIAAAAKTILSMPQTTLDTEKRMASVISAGLTDPENQERIYKAILGKSKEEAKKKEKTKEKIWFTDEEYVSPYEKPAKKELSPQEYVDEEGRPVQTISATKYADTTEPSIQGKVLDVASEGAPIGLIGKGVKAGLAVAKPVLGAAGKSKWFQPVAAAVGWGTGGATYETAKKVIQKGELPSPKELGKEAGLWAGMEVAINSLGWTGRLALAVNRIAKITGETRTSALKNVLKEAKELGLPVGSAAQKMKSDSFLRKEMDDYLKSLEKDTAEAYDTYLKEQVGEQGTRDATDKYASFPTGVPTEIARQKKKLQEEAIGAEAGLVETDKASLKTRAPIIKSADEAGVRDITADRYIMRDSETLSMDTGKVTKDSIGVEGTMLEERGTMVAEQRKGGTVIEPQVQEVPIVQTAATAADAYRSSVQNILGKLEGKIPTWDVERLRKLVEKDSTLWDANDKIIYNDIMKKYGGPDVAPTEAAVSIVEDVTKKAELPVKNRSEWRKKAKAIFVQTELDTRIKVAKYGENPNNLTPEEIRNLPWKEVSDRLGYDKRAIGHWEERLNLIKEGEKLGMTLDEIQAFEESVTKGKLKQPLRSMVGVISGVEVDENGDVVYDPWKGAAGLAVGGIMTRKMKTRPKLSPEAEKVAQMYERNEIAIRDREAITTKSVREAFVRGIVDVQGKAKTMLLQANKELGERARQRLVASAGSNAEASRLNDIHHETIYKGLSIPEEHALDRYINSTRLLEIEGYKPGLKQTEGRTVSQHDAYLKEVQIEFGLTDAQMANVKVRADSYFNAHKALLAQRLAEGLITKEAYKSMENLLYSPRKYLKHLSEMEEILTGRPLSVKESGVKSLLEGSEGYVELRSKLLLQQCTSTVQDLVYKNRAAKSLLDIARAEQKIPVVREAKVIGSTKAGAPIYQEAGAYEKKLSAMVDGNRVDVIVPKEFADSWVKSDPLINRATAEWIQWLGGSKILKAGATGYNPLFIITNMPRDIGLVWSGEQYSRLLPMAAAQFANDFAVVARDVFTNKGRVVDYIKEGGGMDFLTYYGRFKGEGHVGEKVNTLSNLLGWCGEKSEIWTRIAHRERAIGNLTKKFEKKNGRMPDALERQAIQDEATVIAREGSIDFSQGGNAVKAIDNVLPYFNAGIQGTRVFWRNIKNDPVGVSIKMAQLGALSAGIYHWNLNHPGMAQVSERDKVQNFILMIPDILPGVTSYIDDRGDVRYRYIKIAKDQQQRLFTTAVDAMLDYHYTGKVPDKQVFQALGDFFGTPTSPVGNPLLSVIFALGANYDTYTWKKIWKGQEGIKQKEEIGRETNKVAQVFGEITGASPMRTSVAVGKYLPPGNPVVMAATAAMKLASGDARDEVERKGWNQYVSENPGVKRLLSSTNPVNETIEEVTEEKEKAATESHKQNREFDRLVDDLLRVRTEESYQKVFDYVSGAPQNVQDRLSKRYKRALELDGVPEKTYWKSLLAADPITRARLFYSRLKKSPDKMDELLGTANRLSGFVTDDFRTEWERLGNEGVK